MCNPIAQGDALKHTAIIENAGSQLFNGIRKMEGSEFPITMGKSIISDFL